MNAQMCMFKLLKALHSFQDLTEMASCVSSYYTVNLEASLLPILCQKCLFRFCFPPMESCFYQSLSQEFIRKAV